MMTLKKKLIKPTAELGLIMKEAVCQENIG